jgi:hypothetical protein
MPLTYVRQCVDAVNVCLRVDAVNVSLRVDAVNVRLSAR